MNTMPRGETPKRSAVTREPSEEVPPAICELLGERLRELRPLHEEYTQLLAYTELVSDTPAYDEDR